MHLRSGYLERDHRQLPLHQSLVKNLMGVVREWNIRYLPEISDTLCR
jgi:hypothetical protein